MGKEDIPQPVHRQAKPARGTDHIRAEIDEVLFIDGKRRSALFSRGSLDASAFRQTSHSQNGFGIPSDAPVPRNNISILLLPENISHKVSGDSSHIMGTTLIPTPNT